MTNDLTYQIIGCAYNVHAALGPGLLENAYEACLCYELQQCGLFVEKQKALPLIYNEVNLEIGYRIDLLVERKVVVEIKAIDLLHDIHLAQILTYLKLSNLRMGLLLNFNVLSMKTGGVKRVVNGY